MLHVHVIVPTLNAAKEWPRFCPALLSCVRPGQVLVLDSESTDGTPDLARSAGFEIHEVKRKEFNHGGTRQLALQLVPHADIFVYLTQDSVLSRSDAIANLVRVFEDKRVAAACGRQLPRPEAGPIEAHARNFNYPGISEVRSMADRQRLGIRTVFLSNSLAAYRRSTLLEVGGFPMNVIFGEDTCVAARLLLAGYKIAYVSDACAYHSHPYTVLQEFRRYFDIGVLHNREQWILKEFGSAGGEGGRFVASELRYLRSHDPCKIPSALTRSAAKLIAYRLGRYESAFPVGLKRLLSMHSNYWQNSDDHS